MLADVYGIPIHRLSILEEATSMGAALAGGVGVGFYPDFSQSMTMNPIHETLHPIKENQVAYQKFLPIFEAAYQSLVPVYQMLAEVD